MTRRVPTSLQPGAPGRRRLLRFAALGRPDGLLRLRGAPNPPRPAARASRPTGNRFYHYPYTYYPRNFEAPQEFDSLYYKYPIERRIPVYRTDWHNFYPRDRPYHSGHHFLLDVF